MKTMNMFSIILFTLTASGCATDNGHAYIAGKCISCWNNPLTNEPVNHNGNEDLILANSETLDNQTNTSSSHTQKETDGYPKKYTVSFDSNVNVDVAYIKIKKEFNYQSEQEIRQEWGTMAGAKLKTFAYAYDATPSVYYRMRANRQHRGIYVIIDSQIEKTTTNTSKITLSYWMNKNSVNPAPYGESLTKRAKQALSL